MYEEDKNIEISKKKVTTTALNALQQPLWLHLCGEAPEQCNLNHHRLQRAKEDA